MKISYLSIGLLSLLTSLAWAWSKEGKLAHREIFRIRDEIAAHEQHPLATFYDYLDLPPTASLDDINRAYRQKSRLLHPDKVKRQLKTDREAQQKQAAAPKGANAKIKKPSAAEERAAIKEASERQARLSLIVNILRGSSRDRYDHFLAHGFPLWKGTDYYYNRYRPGLGTVILGLFALCGGGLHYLVLYMSWKRQHEFVERYVRFARDTAWGGSLGIPMAEAPVVPSGTTSDDEGTPPVPMNRKQRRMQEKETRGRPKKSGRKVQSVSRDVSSGVGASGVRKRVVAENGKILVVDSLGDVYLEEEDEDGNVQEFLLDPKELQQPTFKDTALVRVPIWLLSVTVGRLGSMSAKTEGDGGDSLTGDSDGAQPTPSTDSAEEEFEMVDKSTESLARAKATGAQQAAKANKRKNRKR
ncbi:hypothetical protein CDD82_6065 [Ophiocordyceps australis]|uniref:J domain-containing protein n=1 Tax=Ophiocordyceps australis TaxID=1399860 RepID=A0A2C5Y6V9_9HYPO|nr:hypothetical protein CDD82_6065 [Ophiocordyceps australis]